MVWYYKIIQYGHGGDQDDTEKQRKNVQQTNPSSMCPCVPTVLVIIIIKLTKTYFQKKAISFELPAESIIVQNNKQSNYKKNVTVELGVINQCQKHKYQL